MFVTVLSKFPKIIFEVFAIVSIFIFIFIISHSDIEKKSNYSFTKFNRSGDSARILPSYNLIASSINRIQFSKPSLNLIYQEIKKLILKLMIFKSLKKNYF